MLSPATFPSGVAICRDGWLIFFLTRFVPRQSPLFRGRQRRAVKMGLFYSRKIYDYNSKESPPSIMVTRKPIGLRESWVRGLVVQGEDESPPVHPTYGKLHCCLIVFFFLS